MSDEVKNKLAQIKIQGELSVKECSQLATNAVEVNGFLLTYSREETIIHIQKVLAISRLDGKPFAFEDVTKAIPELMEVFKIPDDFLTADILMFMHSRIYPMRGYTLHLVKPCAV